MARKLANHAPVAPLALVASQPPGDGRVGLVGAAPAAVLAAPVVAAEPDCAWRQTLQPFRQGDMDAFCGLYAILNALRWAAGPKVITYEICEEVFILLSDHAVKEQGNLGVSTAGISILQLRQLLRCAFAYLRQEYALDFDLAPILAKNVIFAPDPENPAKPVLQVLPNEAIILDLKHTEWHWSVLQGVVGAKLKLFDSARCRTRPLQKIRFDSSYRVIYRGPLKPQKGPGRKRRPKKQPGSRRRGRARHSLGVGPRHIVWFPRDDDPGRWRRRAPRRCDTRPS